MQNNVCQTRGSVLTPDIEGAPVQPLRCQWAQARRATGSSKCDPLALKPRKTGRLPATHAAAMAVVVELTWLMSTLEGKADIPDP